MTVKSWLIDHYSFKDTPTILNVNDRLYTLRNQMLHGGATWNSNVNRDQVTNGQQFCLYHPRVS